MQKVLDLCVEARGAAGKVAHLVQPLAVACEHFSSSFKSLPVLISRKLMSHGSLASKFTVLVFLSSMALFGTSRTWNKSALQTCQGTICVSLILNQISSTRLRGSWGSSGIKKQLHQGKHAVDCRFFSLALKPLPEFWGIQDKYQQYIIVFVLFCQESKFLFNNSSASNDLFKRESLHSWWIWWVASYGNVFLTSVDETTSASKAKKELPLTPLNCSFL